MMPEIQRKGFSGPTSHDFDDVEGNALEKIEKGSSDSQAVTL